MSAVRSLTGRLTALVMAPVLVAHAAADEDGQGMTEYAVVLTLIAAVLVTALSNLRGAVLNIITNTAGYL